MAELQITLGKNTVGSFQLKRISVGLLDRCEVALTKGAYLITREAVKNLSGPSHSQPPRAPRTRRRVSAVPTRKPSSYPSARSVVRTTTRQESSSRPSVDFAPGNPFPGTVSGTLKRSITSDVDRTGHSIRMLVGPGGYAAPYAGIQELGGRAGRNHAATLPARAYMAPAFRAVYTDFIKLVADAILDVRS